MKKKFYLYLLKLSYSVLKIAPLLIIMKNKGFVKNVTKFALNVLEISQINVLNVMIINFYLTIL
jgi:hypothetical protein